VAWVRRAWVGGLGGWRDIPWRGKCLEQMRVSVFSLHPFSCFLSIYRFQSPVPLALPIGDRPHSIRNRNRDLRALSHLLLTISQHPKAAHSTMFGHLHKFRIELDSPPGKVFSGEDTLSGRIVLDSHSDENVGYVLVIFRGTIHIKVHTRVSRGGNNTGQIYEDYISLFEHSEVLYRGHYTLRRDVPYEWSFSFDFGYQSDGSSWPPSGVYDPVNTKKVKYVVIAAYGAPGQDPERVLNMVSHENRGNPSVSGTRARWG
jgi:hypothetical protein